MKIEKIRKSHKNKIIIGSLVGLGIISTAIYLPSHSKYKLTSSIPITTGTVNYIVPDVNIVAMYTVDENGEETKVETLPSGDYQINAKSFCQNKEGNKVAAEFDYNKETKKLNLNLPPEKGTKCHIYFEKYEIKNIELIAAGSLYDMKYVSYSLDNGSTWLAFPTGTKASVPINSLIKYDDRCTNINVCSSSDCSTNTNTSGYIASLGTRNVNDIPITSTYKINGNEKVLYGWTCLAEDTLILVYDENKKKKLKKPIKSLKKGDKVYTYDEEKKQLTTSTIKDIDTTLANRIIAITLNNNEIIRCTENHKFYLKNRGYIKAKELKPKDMLLGMDNTNYEITDIKEEFYQEGLRVYNLKLDNNNNCIIGNLNVITYMATFIVGYSSLINKVKAADCDPC